MAAGRVCTNIRKVQVQCDKHAGLIIGVCSHLRIFGTKQSLILTIHHVVTESGELFVQQSGQILIELEVHPAS